MSRYIYAGPYRNPTEGMYVRPVGEKFEIWVRSDRAEDGSAPPDHKHTSAPSFEDEGEAHEWLDDLAAFYEEDYDQYLDEHHDEIVAQERYENWRNEQ